MKTELIVVGRDDADFQQLTLMLMHEYLALYGDEVLGYCPADALCEVACAVVARSGGQPVASGAFRRFDDTAAELMRIYVVPGHRQHGLGSRVVRVLEQEALRRGFSRMVLVTGSDMPGALALYSRLGYERIENFGPNRHDPVCVCMEKRLLPNGRL